MVWRFVAEFGCGVALTVADFLIPKHFGWVARAAIVLFAFALALVLGEVVDFDVTLRLARNAVTGALCMIVNGDFQRFESLIMV